MRLPVGLSVAAAVESVAVGLPGAGGDRGGAAQGGEGGLGADSVGVVAGGDEQGGGGDDAVALGGEHRRGGAGGQCAQLGVDVGDLVGPGSGGGGPGRRSVRMVVDAGVSAVGAGRVRARAPMSSPPLRRAKRVRTASGAVAGRAAICRWAATRTFNFNNFAFITYSF